MALLPILIAPHPLLKRRAEPVAVVDDEVRRLMDDMLETMYEADGVGLAAPQVGRASRIVVIDVHGKDEPRAPLRLVNPEIVERSEETALIEEGCLSVPEQYAEVRRPKRVKVRYLDETGAPREIEAEGTLGVCLQHEIDHLEGRLFVDHLSMLKRNLILNKVRKAVRKDAS